MSVTISSFSGSHADEALVFYGNYGDPKPGEPGSRYPAPPNASVFYEMNGNHNAWMYDISSGSWISQGSNPSPSPTPTGGGLHYIGMVNYFSDLPSEADDQTVATVRYQGSSGTDPDGTIYAYLNGNWSSFGLVSSDFVRTMQGTDKAGSFMVVNEEGMVDVEELPEWQGGDY